MKPLPVYPLQLCSSACKSLSGIRSHPLLQSLPHLQSLPPQPISAHIRLTWARCRTPRTSPLPTCVPRRTAWRSPRCLSGSGSLSSTRPTTKSSLPSRRFMLPPSTNLPPFLPSWPRMFMLPLPLPPFPQCFTEAAFEEGLVRCGGACAVLSADAAAMTDGCALTDRMGLTSPPAGWRFSFGKTRCLVTGCMAAAAAPSAAAPSAAAPSAAAPSAAAASLTAAASLAAAAAANRGPHDMCTGQGRECAAAMRPVMWRPRLHKCG